MLGTIEGDKETGKQRLEELNQGKEAEEVVGEMYVNCKSFDARTHTHTHSFMFSNSVKEIAKNKAVLSPAAKDTLNMVGGEKNVKDLTKV